jgi:hypothetical protein
MATGVLARVNRRLAQNGATTFGAPAADAPSSSSEDGDMEIPTPAKKQKRAASKKKKATPKKAKAAPKKASAKSRPTVEDEGAEDEEDLDEHMASGANQDGEMVGVGYATPPLHNREGSVEPAQKVPPEDFEDPLPQVWDDYIVRRPEDLDGRRYDSLSNADKLRVADAYAAEFHEQRVLNGDVKFHSRVLSTPVRHMRRRRRSHSSSQLTHADDFSA